MDIFIEPTSVSFNIVKVTYEIIKLVPNHSCEISAFLTEANGNRVKRYNLKLEEPEYNQWGEDDTFLIEWICRQCGLNKAPVVVPEVTEPVVEIVPENPASIMPGFMEVQSSTTDQTTSDQTTSDQPV